MVDTKMPVQIPVELACYSYRATPQSISHP